MREQVDDEVIQILLTEIRTLRTVGSELVQALKSRDEKARALALAAWEQTRRGVGK